MLEKNRVSHRLMQSSAFGVRMLAGWFALGVTMLAVVGLMRGMKKSLAVGSTECAYVHDFPALGA
ncbi:hypothetical protein B1748_05385 [Paenibacillus sp. MY03]|uniref:hypothetical protein n=1 Tax=Paenibacillus sp. MY03 TaxID=302980 RepID=UPI000B3C30CB|nr:hypothetical protein [Paenibacillus sp. MY03]OUS78191.1 hypothetical protein B1748_05385 [Paenibacillus sp. MY03]